MSASERPGDDEAIILTPSMLCEEHSGMARSFSVPFLRMMLVTQKALMESEAFFDIAYRQRNGYDRPAGTGWDEVPEEERPGVPHINAAMRDIEPVCCWLTENVADPYPEQATPTYLNILVAAAGAMGEGGGNE